MEAGSMLCYVVQENSHNSITHANKVFLLT